MRGGVSYATLLRSGKEKLEKWCGNIVEGIESTVCPVKTFRQIKRWDGYCACNNLFGICGNV
jgi:hypothetical protein